MESGHKAELFGENCKCQAFNKFGFCHKAGEGMKYLTVTF